MATGSSEDETLEMPSTLPDLFMDHFNLVTEMDVKMILGSMKATMTTLNLSPFQLVKYYIDHINDALMSIISY